LPSFDGNYNDWIRFRDTFLSLIHNNEQLEDVQKFHYLQSSLKGPAARIVQSIGISKSNYRTAWDAVKARYENSAALKRHHVHTLLDLPAMQKQSPITIREILDDASNHLHALKALGLGIETWDPLIVPILSRKLDPVSVREWERRNAPSTTESPTLRQFTAFLEERAHYLENITSLSPVGAVKPELVTVPGSRRLPRVAAHVASACEACPVCQAAHAIAQCSKFKDASLEGRVKIVQDIRACYNCLQTGHRVQNCTRNHCRLCGKKHHSLLHRENSYKTKEAVGTCDGESQNTVACIAKDASSTPNQVVLSTAVVFIEDREGRKRECRALLDLGSQANLITTECCDRLGLDRSRANARIAGIAAINSKVEGKVDIEIHSRIRGFGARVACLIMSNITEELPNIPIQRSAISIPPNIKLADTRFHKRGRIDLLIGAELFWRLLCVGQHSVNRHLIWQKTQLGWVLGGRLDSGIRNESQVGKCHVVTNGQLHEQLERFWQVEEGITNGDAIDECESHFVMNVKRNPDGRYTVRIPFNECQSRL
ncbi:hypothetical protein WH47_02482, partial [Habropoda laboriosa]